MAAKRRIEWTPETVRRSTEILVFVRENWGDGIARRYLVLLEEFVRLVLHFPKGYPASTMHPDLRMATIHKNVKVVYRVDRDRILIVTILDTRAANPDWT